MRLPRRFVFAAAATFLVACASLKNNTPINGQPETRVKVDNRAYLEMTIYVMRGAERVRLGSAPGSSNSSFVIPADIIRTATQLRFVADPIGSSRASVSEEIYVQPGDEVGLQIPPS